jgi:hypothetical protein
MIYAKNDHGDDELAGCGVVIDETRVLTCAHVVGRFDDASGWAGDAEVRVAFFGALSPGFRSWCSWLGHESVG